MGMRRRRAVLFERSCFLVVGIRAFGGKKWRFGDLREVNMCMAARSKGGERWE